MKKIGEYHATMKKIGDMDRNGPKIGDMAKRAEDNNKIVAAHGNLEKMMKK
jgi:bisphosphoglycerate-independent phosphoglycerate mutase (AlkP superfamily)